MKTTLVYVYPNQGEGEYFNRAFRFLASYHDKPPGVAHDSVVVCNGGRANEAARMLFSSLPNLTLLEHDNSGYDIGAFQKSAREFSSDFMIFFGSGAYLRIPGWMNLMVQARVKYGDTLYGCMGNTGDDRVGVQPHVRTTGFGLSSSLFNQYPHAVTTPGGRYPFEHGPECLSTWITRRGLQVWICGATGQWPLQMANQIPNGFHDGDQSNLLTGDRLSEPPYFPYA